MRAMDTLPHAQCCQAAGTRSVGDDLAGRAPRKHDERINAAVDKGTRCNTGPMGDQMYCHNVCSN